MEELLSPLKTESLTEVFIERFEHLILSGKLKIGQKLPSERELALQLGVSRPVVHEGLVILASKGLITMSPRRGAVVNDYRRDGSVEILNSLVNYQRNNLDHDLVENLIQVRRLFEVENARLAALNCDQSGLQELQALIREEEQVSMDDTERIVELDFAFHLQVAMATGNMIFPLLLNSFKKVYTALTGIFFSDPDVVSVVFQFHRRLVKAIEQKNLSESQDVMKELLEHGRNVLMTIMDM